MKLSDAIKEAYRNAPADVTYYDTLEFRHVSFTDSIRVVCSYKALSTNQGDFIPVIFELTLPETEGGVRGEMTITVNGITKEARVKIREAGISRHSVKVIYRQYIEEAADPVAYLPVPLEISSITETTTGIKATALVPDLTGAPFPRRMMTTTTLPGCNV